MAGVDDNTVEQYRRAVNELDDAIHSPTLSVTADEAGGDALDRAITRYLLASDDVFTTASAEYPSAAMAALAGDMRVLAELAAADTGPALTADEDRSSFRADMSELAGVAAGEAPEPVLIVVADSEAKASGLASLDAIVKTGQDALTGTLSAAVLPHVAELPGIVTDLLGAHAGEVFAGALAAIQGSLARVLRAATRILDAIVKKIVAWLGRPAVDQLTDWVKGLMDLGGLYERALAVPRLRAAATDVLDTAPDAAQRAERIAQADGSHERWQGWVGWGSRGLTWIAPKLTAVPVWGPPAVAIASVTLVIGCAWLTADHLDSYDLAWLPDRFDGVGKALA